MCSLFPILRRIRRTEEAISRILYPYRVAFIHLGLPLPAGSRSRPGSPCSTSEQRGRATLDSPIWPCFARGLPCLPRLRRSGALLPHPFTLTSGLSRGGLLSAALSLVLPRPGVTRRAARRKSGLSSLDQKPRANARLLRPYTADYIALSDRCRNTLRRDVRNRMSDEPSELLPESKPLCLLE